MRAVTEAAQSRLTTISGARDDMFVDTFKVLSSPDALEAHRKRVRGAGPRRFDDVDTWHGEAVGDDLAWVLERCRTAGFDQVVAVDLTLAQFQIPVVKVIIAGTEVTSERNMAMPGPRLRQAGRRSG